MRGRLWGAPAPFAWPRLLSSGTVATPCSGAPLTIATPSPGRGPGGTSCATSDNIHTAAAPGRRPAAVADETTWCRAAHSGSGVAARVLAAATWRPRPAADLRAQPLETLDWSRHGHARRRRHSVTHSLIGEEKSGHIAVAWQTANELAYGESGIVHGAECIAVLTGVAWVWFALCERQHAPRASPHLLVPCRHTEEVCGLSCSTRALLLI